jgi:hypothetical protein
VLFIASACQSGSEEADSGAEFGDAESDRQIEEQTDQPDVERLSEGDPTDSTPAGTGGTDSELIDSLVVAGGASGGQTTDPVDGMAGSAMGGSTTVPPDPCDGQDMCCGLDDGPVCAVGEEDGKRVEVIVLCASDAIVSALLCDNRCSKNDLSCVDKNGGSTIGRTDAQRTKLDIK